MGSPLIDTDLGTTRARPASPALANEIKVVERALPD
jgi:hypothetical protein